MVIRYIAALWQWFGRQGYPCLFRLLTGLYCPGCGGTRALKCLLQGKVLTSLYYNPLIVYMAVVGAVETGLWAADRLRETEGGAGKEAAGKGGEGRGETRGSFGGGGRDRDGADGRKRRPYEKEIYVGIGIVALNWAVKNWVLVVRGTLMIP